MHGGPCIFQSAPIYQADGVSEQFHNLYLKSTVYKTNSLKLIVEVMSRSTLQRHNQMTFSFQIINAPRNRKNRLPLVYGSKINIKEM